MDEKNAGPETQGGVHGSFRTPDRADASSKAPVDAATRARAAATPAHAKNALRRRLPPVPDWVWRLARVTQYTGMALGGLGAALLAGGHASWTRRIVLAVLGAMFGSAFGLLVPLVLFWISVVAMVAGLAVGAIALIVWLVRRAGHH